MEKSFLVIGTGEVGIAMLDSLYKYMATSAEQFNVGALVQPSSASNESAPHFKYAGLVIEAVDLVSGSIENLAGIFRKYDTVICCSGFSIGTGMQVKIDMNFVTNPASLMDLADAGSDPNLNPMQQLHERLRNLPQVTIARLAGFARGGGNELAMALDMRFAIEGKTWLGQPETLMGIIPGGGGTQYLSKLAGRARALEVILGGELLDSATAEKYGVINKAIPEEEIDSYIERLATRIASLLPGVINAAKSAVDAASHNTNGITTESAMLLKVFAEPAASAKMIAAMEKGAQTVAGEHKLEEILNSI